MAKKKTPPPPPPPAVPKMTVDADDIISAFLDVLPDEAEAPAGAERALQTVRNLVRVFEDLRSGRSSGAGLDSFVVEDLEDVIRVLETGGTVDQPTREEVRSAIDDALAEAVDEGVQWALTQLEDKLGEEVSSYDDIVREINKLRDVRVEVK